MEWKHTNSPIKKKFLGTVVSKEGHADDSLLGHEKTHHSWFSWKRCNCELLLIANILGKIHLIYWMTLLYMLCHSICYPNFIYIYIYIYMSSFINIEYSLFINIANYIIYMYIYTHTCINLRIKQDFSSDRTKVLKKKITNRSKHPKWNVRKQIPFHSQSVLLQFLSKREKWPFGFEKIKGQKEMGKEKKIFSKRLNKLKTNNSQSMWLFTQVPYLSDSVSSVSVVSKFWPSFTE